MTGRIVRPTEQVALGPLSDALADWTRRSGPTYLRLADALADAIAQGHLGLGSRLPSERALAHHLHVARGTVVAAYEALRARGIVHTRRGSGTVVESRAVKARAHRAPLLSRLVDGHKVRIDMAIGALMLSPSELGDIADISVSMKAAARLAPAHGYAPLGLAQLRVIVAERFCAKGIPTGPEQILITTGGQNALSLLAATLISANERVITESPTYPAAIEAFIRAGARVDGVERDHAGPIVSRFEEVVARGSARMIYVVPTCHNPTGGIMSEGRRLALLRIARERHVLVVEDTVLEDLALERRPPPSLAALDPERVITIGSLSKTVWGGLRVGWIRASSETILRLGRVRASYDLGSPLFEQAAALRILEHYEEIVARRRQLVRARIDTLSVQLRSRLPEWSFADPHGGLSVWARLPRFSADTFAQLALRRGVAIAPGRTAAPGEDFLSHIRLSAGPAPELLEEGVARLAEAWEQLQSAPAACDEEGLLV